LLRSHDKAFCAVCISKLPGGWKVRGRVSKYVTNVSKTAVMDVISFLCVSLGSSTVQLHDSVGSRRACTCSGAGFCSQNRDRTSGVYCRKAAFCCMFCRQSGLNSKDIHKNVSCLCWEVSVAQSGSICAAGRRIDSN
jgi:hypothetical protein